MKVSEKNQIHILDLDMNKIVSYNNDQLCNFINDIISNENPIASIKDLQKKRFLFLPNQSIAKKVVMKIMEA